MMWGYGGYGGYGFGGGMGIGMLLFWGVIIFAVIMMVRGLGGNSNPPASGARIQDKTALDILGERYARGEIERAEFEQRRNELSETRVASANQKRGVGEARATEAS